MKLFPNALPTFALLTAAHLIPAAPAFYYNQAGYHPLSEKKIVLYSSQPFENTTYQVVNRDLDVVTSGQLTLCPPHPTWSGTYYRVDLSLLNQPGEYILKTEKGNSPILNIDPEAYRNTLDLASRWYYYQRCGCEIEGWHKACHTDDGTFRDTTSQENFGAITGTKETTGGWHDAGDYNKWTRYSFMGIWSLMEATHILPGKKERLLDEAKWEVEYVLKVQADNGQFYELVGWHPVNNEDGSLRNHPWGCWCPPEEETDGVQGTQETRYIELDKSKTNHPIQIVFGLAKYAEQLNPDDAQRKNCIDAAVKSRQLCLETLPQPVDRTSQEQGLLTMLDLSLYKLTKDTKYITSANRGIKHLLICQDDMGFFYPRHNERKIQSEYHWGFMPVIALLEYAETQRSSPLLPSIEQAIAKFMDFELNHLKGSPFEHRREYTIKDNPLDLPPVWQGYNNYFSTGAYLAARAGRIYNQPEWVNYGERQLQWVLGRNPLGVCMMEGVGVKNPGLYHTRYVTIPGHEDGRIPGGVVNGINGEEKDGKPTNRPLLDIGNGGNSDSWQTNEYWIPNQGWFMLGLTEIQKYRQSQKPLSPQHKESESIQ